MDDRLTIALISTERLWQGGEEQACQLVLGLRQRGHRCVIAGLRNRPLTERLEAERFPIIPLDGKLPTPRRCLALRHALRKHDIDVVYFNDAHGVTLGGLAAWRLPNVLTVASRRASFPIRSPAKYRHLCDQIYCVSQCVAQLCEQAGIPADHLRIVHDGVDPKRVESGDRRRGRTALKLNDTDQLLLSVGSLVPCKGHAYLIEALPHILRRHPNVQLAIAGSGDLRTALHKLAVEQGVENQVRLLGFRTDVPDLIHACDLFVFPSVQEGMGSTLVDVMLAGRPIVTTTAGGIPDVVFRDKERHQPLTWTVPPANSDQLAHTVLKAMEATDQNAVKINEARIYAQAHFTVDHMVEQTVRAFRAGLRQRRG